MPETHKCEECGAKMLTRKVMIGNLEREEWYCPRMREDEKSHFQSLAIARLDERRHPAQRRF